MTDFYEENDATQPKLMPAELQFLLDANSDDIIDWMIVQIEEEHIRNEDVWNILEKRLREHPEEARELAAYGTPPLHDVLYLTQAGKSSLATVNLLIALFPEALQIEDRQGNIPLHEAARHPCIECFRAVLYSGTKEATVAQGWGGKSPLHQSMDPSFSIYACWELICYNRECASILNVGGHNALQHLDWEHERFQRREHYEPRHLAHTNAKRVLLKLVLNYNYVLEVPDNATIALIESHPACGVLATKLEPGSDDFVLHQASAVDCPPILIEALIAVFPEQLRQSDFDGQLPLHIALQSGSGGSVRMLASIYPTAMTIIDPVTGRMPIEQALLNVASEGTLENIDAVNVLLRADPAFLLRNNGWRVEEEETASP